MSTLHETLWREQFTDGRDLDERWALLAAGDFRADDGVATPGESGLHLVTGGSNETTGEPAFSKDLGGPFGHLKWFASTRRQFDPTPGILRFGFRGGARILGVDGHPYGDGVTDAGSDMRLGSLVLNVMDFTSGMVFDFWMCNEAIYPYYERIPVPGSVEEVFGQTCDPVRRHPSAVHDLAIEIDAGAGTAAWEVDGEVIATADNIGRPHPGWSTALHHGGQPADARLGPLVASMGLMTLLDASLPPSEQGLVDLGVPYRHPGSFHGGPHLFGQGVEATVEHIEVTRR